MGLGKFFSTSITMGTLDILNGNGLDDPETTDDDWAAKQKVRLYVNQGIENEFKMKDEAQSRGIADEGENRGIMTFDYDMDGDLDVLIINHGESPNCIETMAEIITILFAFRLWRAVEDHR